MEIARDNSFRLTPDIGTDSEIATKVGNARSLKLGSKVTVNNEYSGETYAGEIVSMDDPDWPEVKDQHGHTQTFPMRMLSPLVDPNLNKRKKKKTYYMSFARSKTGEYSYPTSEYESGKVMMVIDGEKLQQAGYTGEPVDYWAGFTAGRKNEMEDRVYSTKSHIPNADQFIKEIHVYINLENTDAQRLNMYKRLVRQVKLWGRKHGVPAYAYDNVKSFNLLNRKQLDVSQLSSKPEQGAPYHRTDRGNFDAHTELLNVNDRDKLSRAAKDQLYGMQYRDYIRSLQADVHNARQSSERKNLDKFIAQIKQRGIYSLRDYIDFVTDKFR